MNTSTLKIERQRVGSVDVITPIGALIDKDAEQFIKLVMERIGSSNPRLVLCLQDVPYIDSIALEGLLTASEQLADRAAGLKLACVTQTCREILELAGLAPRMRFFEELQDAIKSFI